MRIRVKFRKNGVMRFIGHLDIMRYFQKAMRRADIDIAYSEGFSPHQIMSFAAPLGVGVTSDGEYFDIEANSTRSSEESIRALNQTMAEGMEVVSWVALREGAKKAMTAVAAADYIVYFKKREDFSQQEISGMIEAYYADRDKIEIVKQSKKSERVVDLKPLIYEFRPYEDRFFPENKSDSSLEETIQKGSCGTENTEYTEDFSINILSDLECRKGFFLRLCTGSTDNIKPELVLQDFYVFFGKKYDPFNLQIHRLEVYERTGQGLVPLYMAGDEIC
ncbi:MAG: TIGR03936 family radical SAM-associated protein [Clostridiales bacterium]|nr:TIGR03936 family radical SAM-associated protein [Clostridiales bacterium]